MFLFIYLLLIIEKGKKLQSGVQAAGKHHFRDAPHPLFAFSSGQPSNLFIAFSPCRSSIWESLIRAGTWPRSSLANFLAVVISVSESKTILPPSSSYAVIRTFQPPGVTLVANSLCEHNQMSKVFALKHPTSFILTLFCSNIFCVRREITVALFRFSCLLLSQGWVAPALSISQKNEYLAPFRGEISCCQ